MNKRMWGKQFIRLQNVPRPKSVPQEQNFMAGVEYVLELMPKRTRFEYDELHVQILFKYTRRPLGSIAFFALMLFFPSIGAEACMRRRFDGSAQGKG